MRSRPIGQTQPIELRDASPYEVARCLRAMLGLAPDEPAPGELAASLRRPLPLLVERLDAGAWIAWCLAGLPLFDAGLPNLRLAKVSAGRVVVALAMLGSEGNVSAGARAIGCSRKVLRDNLRIVDLYPWHPPLVDSDEGDTGDAVGEDCEKVDKERDAQLHEEAAQ